jgi:hypothetical protein
MESVRLIPPTVLERYQGYGARLETVSKAPQGNTGRYQYELSDARGKVWDWDKGIDYLEISSDGMSSYYDGRLGRIRNYQCALDSARIFDGNKPVVFSWYERRDKNNLAVRTTQQSVLSEPDFGLPPLRKPEQMPFKVSRIQWAYDPTSYPKLSSAKATLSVWCDNTVYEMTDFLYEWYFHEEDANVGRLHKIGVEQSRSNLGDHHTSMVFFYSTSQKATSVRGRLSLDNGWPVEITAKLPIGWQFLKGNMDLSFQTRIADFPTQKQLFERNHFWRIKAEQNTQLKTKNATSTRPNRLIR